jgi:hypothetical protein
MTILMVMGSVANACRTPISITHETAILRSAPRSRPGRFEGTCHTPEGNPEDVMATMHLKQTTTLTPERFIAGLTDFGPNRSKLFANSADGYLKVHDQGTNHADVTEGSAGIWERLHYDWSDPDHVILTTTDSNVWGGASGHTYTFTRQPNGTTDVDVVVVREGKNLKGRMLAGVVAIAGTRFLGRGLARTIKAIEARDRQQPQAHESDS